MSRTQYSFLMDWEIGAINMIDTRDCCDFNHVIGDLSNFNTIYMLGALPVFFEDNHLAGNRYFRFQNVLTFVRPFQVSR